MRTSLTVTLVAVVALLGANAEATPEAGDIPVEPVAEGPREASTRVAGADTVAVLQTTSRAMLAETEYEAFRFEHAAAAHTAQMIQTWIVFGVVLLVFGFGVYASWVYFRQESRPAIQLALRGKAQAADVTSPERKEHKLEVSTGGFSVSTHALGVVVLTLSLGFFYLYLRHAYPINDLKATSQSTVQP